jgi:hypothetical protein
MATGSPFDSFIAAEGFFLNSLIDDVFLARSVLVYIATSKISIKYRANFRVKK